MKRLVIIFTAIIIIFFGVTFSYVKLTDPGPYGGAFTLTDSNGNTVTESDIRAQPSAIFFGYTMCPDVCPTTLMDLTDWLEKLGPDADKIKVWFFTVDPERDTPQVMHDYISNFNDKIIGVSGDPEKVHAAIKSFNVFAQKVDGKDGDYTYDHSSAIILLKKGGKMRGLIQYQEDTKTAVEWLKSIAESAD